MSNSFFKNFFILLFLAVIGIGIYYYFNSSNNTNDDKQNIENTVQNETASNEENIEGTVVAKRSTENN